ncbi:hypothetical protein [Parvularcula lutaonensis]|uniref:Uncharacterized protein n=1 Tax=Parvularcula lutaonensis TaxID=491923 RepID=A0ABV7MCC1_9PROT|nr:hypothetical protein [Parvularcula lutaonensis]
MSSPPFMDENPAGLGRAFPVGGASLDTSQIPAFPKRPTDTDPAQD